MGKNRCSVPNCGHYQSPNEPYKFYQFPKDDDLRREWCEILGMNPETLQKYALVCGRHFSPDNAKRPRLSADVLPLGKDDVQAASTSGASSHVIVLDSPEQSVRRKHPQFATPGSSQASSSSATAAKDLTFTSTESPSERIIEKYYNNNDPRQPKKDVLAKDESRNFIVSEQQLRLLFRRCPNCGSSCGGEAIVISHGVDTEFAVDCPRCLDIVTWSSQPEMPACDLKKGNLDTTAAVFLSGNFYGDFESFASVLNLKIMGRNAFYSYARQYIIPLLDEKFIGAQNEVLNQIKQRQTDDDQSELSIAVDGRYSKVGHNATFGMTTAMDVQTGIIVASVVKSKSDIDTTSSSQMETIGTRLLLKSLLEPFDPDMDQPLKFFAGQVVEVDTSDESPDFELPAPESSPPISLRIGTLVTDENRSVAKMVRDEFLAKDGFNDKTKLKKHQFDPWHMRKAIMKKFSAAALRKQNELLSWWLPSIRTWIWTAMKECKGDGERLVELFRSMSYHIRGDHNWDQDDTYAVFKQCAHEDVGSVEYAYLLPESDAYSALIDIVEDRKIHDRLRQCGSSETSLLESFHSLICQYIPKDKAVSPVGCVARSRMAMLDWNENVNRLVKLNAQGGVQLKFTHPSSVDDWRVRQVLEERTYEWREEIKSCLNGFAINRWNNGHKIKERSTIVTHRPMVDLHEPLDKYQTALHLYRL